MFHKKKADRESGWTPTYSVLIKSRELVKRLAKKPPKVSRSTQNFLVLTTYVKLFHQNKLQYSVYCFV